MALKAPNIFVGVTQYSTRVIGMESKGESVSSWFLFTIEFYDGVTIVGNDVVNLISGGRSPHVKPIFHNSLDDQ